MDGTLLDDNQRISEENAYWIRRAEENGVRVILATGRGIQSVRPFLSQLETDNPMVLVNGSEVWNNGNELRLRYSLPHEAVLRMREIALEHRVWYWTYTVHGVMNEDNWDTLKPEGPWLKFGFHTEDTERLQVILRQVQSLGPFEITNSSPYNLEINPPGISKATGIEEVCRMLELTMAQVAAVGDSLNDLAMIRAAGFGVAMGNAQEKVKQAAKWVTGTNVENGVAQVIERVLTK